MSIRGIYRGANKIGSATPTNAPIYVDSDDNKLKMVPAGSGSTEVEVMAAHAPVEVTAATVALTLATHGNKTTIFNRATGIAATLPASTGSGAMYRIAIMTAFTGAASLKVANATDVINGNATLYNDAGSTVAGFSATASDDTIDLFGTANSTGGLLGALIEIQDVKAGFWHVHYVSDAGGTEATPFSASV